jgi:hypothetical protein
MDKTVNSLLCNARAAEPLPGQAKPVELRVSPLFKKLSAERIATAVRDSSLPARVGAVTAIVTGQ